VSSLENNSYLKKSVSIVSPEKRECTAAVIACWTKKLEEFGDDGSHSAAHHFPRILVWAGHKNDA